MSLSAPVSVASRPASAFARDDPAGRTNGAHCGGDQGNRAAAAAPPSPSTRGIARSSRFGMPPVGRPPEQDRRRACGKMDDRGPAHVAPPPSRGGPCLPHACPGGSCFRETRQGPRRERGVASRRSLPCANRLLAIPCGVPADIAPVPRIDRGRAASWRRRGGPAQAAHASFCGRSGAPLHVEQPDRVDERGGRAHEPGASAAASHRRPITVDERGGRAHEPGPAVGAAAAAAAAGRARLYPAPAMPVQGL